MAVWNPNGMFPFYIVCLLTFRFFAGRSVQMTFAYKDAMGLWWEDRWRPVVSAVTNLIVNIILVNTIGIAGVIISTFICSVFIATPWGNYVLFKNYFKDGLKKYFLNLGYCYLVTFIACIATYYACSFVTKGGILCVVLRGVICCIVPNVLMIILYFWTPEFKDSKEFAIGVYRKALAKFTRLEGVNSGKEDINHVECIKR
jgi:hypothetical protein